MEGLNNKAKVTMRKSYGFRTYRVLEIALYHSLGKLPERDSTHDFSDEPEFSLGSLPQSLPRVNSFAEPSAPAGALPVPHPNSRKINPNQIPNNS